MTTEVFVYTMNQLGARGAWSRYVYPWDIEAQAQLNNDMFLRSGDAIYLVDKSRLTDDTLVDDVVVESPVDMVIRWPYLDFGAPGVTKMLAGFDTVGTGVCEVRVGWNERDYAQMTPAYEIVADTVTGGIIPLPLSSPSFSFELTFRSEENTIESEWLASNFYLQDFRMTS